MKPVDSITDIVHIPVSIIGSQQTFGDIVSPLFGLNMYTKTQDEQIETMHHEFVNLHYKSVSAQTLDTVRMKITEEWGEFI